jgi:hypothetical protein
MDTPPQSVADLILQSLRPEGTTQRELISETGFARATISKVCLQLLDEGRMIAFAVRSPLPRGKRFLVAYRRA